MDFSVYPLWLNLAIFAGVAVVVWIGGARLAEYADELAQRYHLSRALLGLFLLAGVTSLPDVSTSFTAAASGNPDLAVNNLLGSIMMQMALLAVVDLFIGKRALTAVVPDALVLLQGSFNIVLLALISVAITIGDINLFGAGAWSWGLLGAAIYALIKLAAAERHRKPWVVNPEDEQVVRQQKPAEATRRKHRDNSRNLLFSKLVISACVILGAGATVAYTGEAIAGQSGMGQSFAGVTLVAITTSLPETSTVFATMRRGYYTMAISDILGTNILNIALVSGVDLIAPNSPVLDEAGGFSVLAANLGIVMTGLFMLGLSERADRTYLRMGMDSILVLLVYGAGMFFLFRTRGGV
jgi:cation:H+ antiporter